MLNSRQTQVPGKRFQPLASYQSLCTGLEQTEPRGHRGGGTVQERGTLQGPAQRFPECSETGLRSQTGFSMIRFVRCLHHSTVRLAPRPPRFSSGGFALPYRVQAAAASRRPAAQEAPIGRFTPRCPALPAPLSPAGSPWPPTPCGPAPDSSSPPWLQHEINVSTWLRSGGRLSAPAFSPSGLHCQPGRGPAPHTSAHLCHTSAAAIPQPHRCAATVSLGKL